MNILKRLQISIPFIESMEQMSMPNLPWNLKKIKNKYNCKSS